MKMNRVGFCLDSTNIWQPKSIKIHGSNRMRVLKKCKKNLYHSILVNNLLWEVFAVNVTLVFVKIKLTIIIFNPKLLVWCFSASSIRWSIDSILMGSKPFLKFKFWEKYFHQKNNLTKRFRKYSQIFY